MTVRRAFIDAMISAGSVLALLVTLALLDDRVRDQLHALTDPRTRPVALGDIGQYAGEIAGVVLVAARNQSIDHAPLVIFALAAALLTIFMLRT